MTSYAPIKPWTCILFDLDGTITDSAPGILHRLTRTLQTLNHPIPPVDELMAFVGPPILDGFRLVANLSPAQAEEALVVYRALAAADGPESDSVVYPGIVGVLRDAHKAGTPLAITTSKSERQANRVLQHLGIDSLFTVITGSSEDESRSTKADVISEALVRLREKNVSLDNVVLVGDRHHDVEGAAAHGIPTILVEWGYGSPAEAVGANAIVHSADQLQGLLV